MEGNDQAVLLLPVCANAYLRNYIYLTHTPQADMGAILLFRMLSARSA